MKYMTQSIASTTWVGLNRSRIFFLPNSLYGYYDGADRSVQITPIGCASALRLDGLQMTTLRCPGAFDFVGSSSDFIAASTPPARCGTPAAARPISTPDKAPIRVSSLHSPRCPMRNTLPATLLKPEPSDMF